MNGPSTFLIVIYNVVRIDQKGAGTEPGLQILWPIKKTPVMGSFFMFGTRLFLGRFDDCREGFGLVDGEFSQDFAVQGDASAL